MEKRNIIIATIKKWNIENYYKIKEKYSTKYNFFLFDNHKEFSYDKINKLEPNYIFFPHWSWIISEKIYKNFECIVFHMTDLPFGRGGSPLQNLIIRGYKETKISALRVSEGIDAGDVYMKKQCSLEGKAEDIFIRASKIVYEEMIPKIIEENIKPKKQEGEPVLFKRRSPQESNIYNLKETEKIYDFIRMLDAEGYPKAFISNGDIIYEFSEAKIADGKIIAKVNISKKE